METLVAKAQSELAKIVRVLTEINKKLEKGAQKLNKGYEDKIEKPMMSLGDNKVDFNMLQVYQLGKTPAGMDAQLHSKLFSYDDLALIKELHAKEYNELLQDIEELCVLNQTQFMSQQKSEDTSFDKDSAPSHTFKEKAPKVGLLEISP